MHTTADPYAQLVRTRAELRHDGWTDRRLREAVGDARLLRVRRGLYALPSAPPEVIDAVRIGGRLTCVSLLRHCGVFVRRSDGLHVHLPQNASRLRPAPTGTVRHWHAAYEHAETPYAAHFVDAVRHSIRCQSPRDALATLDSIVHHGLMSQADVRDLVHGMPARFHALAALIDPSAESGPETFMRLILRSLGVAFETQVRIAGVGRVDFVVEGWLIIECDSREFHEGWERQRADRQRDLAAAERGYVTVRPVAADILGAHGEVRARLERILRAFGPPAVRQQFRKNAA